MFLSAVCWTLALLWLITEFIKHKSFATAGGIAFASYSLLMTAYPQSVVMYAYLITGFTFIRLWQSNYRLKAKFGIALAMAGAALLGAVTAFPAYLDLLTTVQRSARLNVGDEFFLAVLPPLKNINDLALFLSQLFDAFWFGNPIIPKYPFVFNGLSLTPFYFILLLLSLPDGQWRHLWPWQIFVVACLLATIWPPAYLFIVHYMGFHLSRSLPLGGAIIPGFVLGGYALDHILRTGFKRFLYPITLLLTPLLLMSMVSFSQRTQLQTGFIVLCFLLVLTTGWFVITKKPILLVLLTITSVLAYGFTTVFIRPLSEIQISSSLVDKVRLETEDGSRYALIGPELAGILPPNEETLLQLDSIHSYDSLSSVNYQRLVQQLSETGATTYGRHFNGIASEAKLDQAAFSYMGIGLLLSRYRIHNDQFIETGEINGIKFYRPLTPPILAAQLVHFNKSEGEQVVLSGSLNEQSRLPVKKITAFDDFMRFQVTPVNQETLLFVSQQAHPYWQATAQGSPLVTKTINDFYLGVIIPPHTAEVELDFRPFILWSWVPQAIYIALGFGLVIRWLKNRLL